MSVEEIDSYYHFDEVGERITISIYEADDTGKLMIWVVDSEDTPTMLNYIPESVEDAVEWYERVNKIALIHQHDNSPAPEIVSEPPAPVATSPALTSDSSDTARVANFSPDQMGSFHAGQLMHMIEESISFGAFADELDIEYNDATGGIIISHKSAWAEINVKYLLADDD